MLSWQHLQMILHLEMWCVLKYDTMINVWNVPVQGVVRLCVIRAAGHTVCSATPSSENKKWKECSVNEDYWSTCDSLNSSGFVLLHPENYKVTVERFFCPHIICQTVTLFKPLLNNVSIHSKSSFKPASSVSTMNSLPPCKPRHACTDSYYKYNATCFVCLFCYHY